MKMLIVTLWFGRFLTCVQLRCSRCLKMLQRGSQMFVHFRCHYGHSHHISTSWQLRFHHAERETSSRCTLFWDVQIKNQLTLISKGTRRLELECLERVNKNHKSHRVPLMGTTWTSSGLATVSSSFAIELIASRLLMTRQRFWQAMVRNYGSRASTTC